MRSDNLFGKKSGDERMGNVSTNRLLQLSRSGQGLEVFDFPVELEPALQKTSSRLQNQRPIDDGRIPSFLGRLLASKQSVNSSNDNAESASSLSLLPHKSSGVPVVSFLVNLPNELKIPFEQAEQLYVSLSNSAAYISYEIVGTSKTISFQITCPETEKSAVFAHLKNHLPSVNFRESEDLLRNHFRSDRTNETVGVDFGLARAWFVPLPFGKSFATDTLLPLVASFEELADGETACFQVISSRTRQNWSKGAKAAIFDRNGQLVFSNLQDQLSGIKEKLYRPLLAVQIRLIVQSGSKERSLQIARRIGAFFRQFSSPNGNELFPLQNEEGLDQNKHLQSVLNRTTFRSGILISAQELSAIFHLPSDAVKSKKLRRDENRTKAAPEFATKGTFILGENCHASETRVIKISNGQRLKHIWITGASGCGKSSAIAHLAEQDAKAGNGFCICEPHADLINEVISRIPENRIKDVILFDPADEAFPIGFNPLHANSELEKTLLSSDLTAIFQRFWTSQGDIITNVLHNAVLAFLSSTKGGTLIDLRHFLVDKEFRSRFLETIEDDEIRFYWTKEFPSLAGRITPLLTRLNMFLRSKLIRNILAQRNNKLDFRRIMDERKILLLKLTHGALGREHAQLLGSLLIAKLYQTALSRQDMAGSDRSPFFVSIDEAHHHLVPSISLLLSEGRKHGTGILISTQDTQQIASRDIDILSSLITNCYTRICFRSDTDAEKHAKGFSFFTAEHFKNLGVGEAICRFEQSRFDFNLKTFPLAPVPAETARQKHAEIIEHSRKTYATPIGDLGNEPVIKGNILTPNIRIESNPVIEPEPAHYIEENPVIEALDHIKHGRGGRHHQEIQAVIKRMAESYGFLVEIEKIVSDGAGSVDVSLERENLKIACEVSVTSSIDYETKNVLKCLAAGYDYSLVVVSNQKKLSPLKTKLFAAIPVGQKEKVKAFGLTGLLEFLRELTVPTKASKKSDKPAGQRLNFTEACEFFDVTSSTLYRWVREGRVPFYRPGREYQFDRDELVLIGKHDLSGKRKAIVKLSPLSIEKRLLRGQKEQDSRYRKLLKLDKIEGPLHTRREKEADSDS